MKSIRRFPIWIPSLCPAILTLLLGIGGCKPTAETPLKNRQPDKSLVQNESTADAPAADVPVANHTTEEPSSQKPTVEAKSSAKADDSNRSADTDRPAFSGEEEARLPDEKEIQRRQEEMEQQRQEEEKKYWASLGNPLVDHPEELKRAHPVYPVWIDTKKKEVVLIGTVCQTEAPLEMFACLRGTKEHEAILSVPTQAFIVHAALLGVGAKAGNPAQYGPEGQYTPADGTEIAITVHWKDGNGELQSAKAQDWIKNMKTGEPLKTNWIFGGSGFWKDEESGKEYYKAEGGDFICVSNFPSAMLDLPIASSDANANLLFQANPARVPRPGTPVTVVLSPQLKPDPKSNENEADEEKNSGKTNTEK